MIITVTPNPSVDRTVFVDALPRGAVIRSRRTRSEPSGKGVNVALALRAHDHEVINVLPVGGPVGTQIEAMLRDADVLSMAVPIAGDIRSNISLVEPDGTVTKVNEAGPQLTEAEVAALTGAALEKADGASWLAGCGSLPAGVPADFYASLVTEGRRRGVRVAVDSSGPALRAALPAGPDLVKPNAHELAEVVDRPLQTLGDVVDAAQVLRQRGARAVLASLGADGAILVDDNGTLHGRAPVAQVVSAVGAGDALLAGFLAAGGCGAQALRSALAWAAAAVQHEGTLFSAADPGVTVTIDDTVDRDYRLVEQVAHP
ncbi:1-phosphofructokinase [Planosporangium flavigriseum]|uniref:1-phosphofructokinase n=1 Tax=Planosporangium flavigriseum TaxID=373681 RepID=A0A8J3M072_9ACTN|nr:1-phosphofructokinase [Planosporangium flavigriseum]NJC68022.1 1-phosphofructokinase [Planosporangium flavigriseum]GIG76645.1 1-phosphofructokinase [Planosporangium flavigriseum]